MLIAAKALIGLIAALHIYILWLEMFAWESRGPRVFRTIPRELFPKTRSMMANQGLYNGFLAAGLIWSLVAGHDLWWQIAVFFLSCVAIAGIFGGLTAARRIFYIQAVPAIVALVLLALG
jgi:putative membrane protein